MILLIEKFLEVLYLYKYPKDKSFPRWYLTLSLLLAKESPIEEIFGKNAIKIIKYILSDSKGLNIRNKLMHFDLNFKIQETINFDNTMLLLYVLLVILNSWILFNVKTK